MAVDVKYQGVEESGLSIMKDVFGPILNRSVEMSILDISEASEEAIASQFSETPVLVEAPLEGAVEAMQYYLFSQKLAAAITDLMVMGDGTAPFNEHESLDGIAEATNQIVGAQATQWSDEFRTDIRSGGAQGRLAEIGELKLPYDTLSLVSYKIEIEEWGEANFFKLIPNNVLETFSEFLSDEEGGGGSDLGIDMPEELPTGEGQPRAAQKPKVRTAQFGEFEGMDASGQVPGSAKNLDLLLDISLPVTIELGRTQMLIRDVLEIGPGSVIELQKLSGEPVDLYINDKRFALGEVVVIDENFGIRITELLSVEERIKALK